MTNQTLDIISAKIATNAANGKQEAVSALVELRETLQAAMQSHPHATAIHEIAMVNERVNVRNRSLEHSLRAVEWVMSDTGEFRCPHCKNSKAYGHWVHCALGDVLNVS